MVLWYLPSTWLVEIDPRLPGLTGDGGRLPCIREGSGKDPSVKKRKYEIHMTSTLHLVLTRLQLYFRSPKFEHLKSTLTWRVETTLRRSFLALGHGFEKGVLWWVWRWGRWKGDPSFSGRSLLGSLGNVEGLVDLNNRVPFLQFTWQCGD